jgi:hypothetical protein
MRRSAHDPPPIPSPYRGDPCCILGRGCVGVVRMSEMVERVARAIEAKSDYVISQHHAKALARAAIEAMREPTAAMIEAEPDDDGEFNKTNSVAHARAFWQAMIDEALK